MVEIESEGELTRTEVAEFLREFADELDDGAAHEHDDRTTRDQDDEVTRIGDGPDDTANTDVDRTDTDYDESVDAHRITLIVGGDSATVTVPNTVEFDVEVESRSPMLSSGVNQEITFDLSWAIENPDDLDDDWLEVQ